jgi:hypothetical protein
VGVGLKAWGCWWRVEGRGSRGLPSGVIARTAQRARPSNPRVLAMPRHGQRRAASGQQLPPPDLHPLLRIPDFKTRD